MLCCYQIDIGPLVIIDKLNTDPKEKKRKALAPDFSPEPSPVVKPKADQRHNPGRHNPGRHNPGRHNPRKHKVCDYYASVGCLNDHHGCIIVLLISIGGKVLCVGGEFSQEGQ